MGQYPNVLNGTVPPGPSGTWGNVVGQYARPLRRGESIYIFGVATVGPPPPIIESNVSGEAVVVGESSLAVCIATGEPSQGPNMITLELGFSGAPGAFEIDIQEADTDADAFYILPATAAYAIKAVNAVTNNARVDLQPTGGKFIRAYVAALANAVKTTLKISRLS